jgi:hypothetical protein
LRLVILGMPFSLKIEMTNLSFGIFQTSVNNSQAKGSASFLK